jgi:hypothetical protein
VAVLNLESGCFEEFVGSVQFLEGVLFKRIAKFRICFSKAIGVGLICGM